jgi:hypothetical protein
MMKKPFLQQNKRQGNAPAIASNISNKPISKLETNSSQNHLQLKTPVVNYNQNIPVKTGEIDKGHIIAKKISQQSKI